MSATVRRPRLLAWLGGAVIGVARKAAYARRLPERMVHDVSTSTGIAAFACCFRVLARRRPLRSGRHGLGVVARWPAMTVGFEFGFGRLVAKQSWSHPLVDYNLARGRDPGGPEAVRRGQRGRGRR